MLNARKRAYVPNFVLNRRSWNRRMREAERHTRFLLPLREKVARAGAIAERELDEGW